MGAPYDRRYGGAVRPEKQPGSAAKDQKPYWEADSDVRR